MTANQQKIRAWNYAWNHGHDDCQRGQHANPYTAGSYLGQAWAEGHYQAEIVHGTTPTATVVKTNY